jgi:hypothetical protein
MSGISKKLMGTTAAGGEALAIEDVFSTYLYTGNGSTQTITNGIDLDGEGGLVWTKGRIVGGGTSNHRLVDTVRGATKSLASNLTSAEGTDSTGLTAFSSDGYTLGSDSDYNYGVGTNPYASWTFRKAPRFFDVVTWTGDGVAGRTIPHNLGTTVGTILVKNLTSAEYFAVYHISQGETKYALLGTTDAFSTFAGAWDNTAPTTTEFSVGNWAKVNTNGDNYVAYLFAHDPLGPSGDGSDGLIACGGFTTDGSGAATVNLGWEPQWILAKRSDNVQDWKIIDTMRGFAIPASSDAPLFPNSSAAEGAGSDWGAPTATGFIADSQASSANFIYIAIRRGPMRAPTSGTEVFATSFYGSGADSKPPAYRSPFAVDTALQLLRNGGNAVYPFMLSRLTGTGYLTTSSTNAEGSSASNTFDYNNGYNSNAPASEDTVVLAHMLRRAPGFFDAVCYSGDGVAGRTVPHNLGVAPELIIHKCRNSASFNWYVYAASLGVDYRLVLDATSAAQSGYATLAWNNTTPTDAEITLGSWGNLNGSGNTYIAYLFATLPGVSKVFSVTKSSGSAASVDCGFTSGSRFVLLKRTDSTGDWYVWDTARGIVAGDDPYLLLNSTAAEVTNTDYIDPTSNGFTIVDGGLANGDYIGLAIA